MLNKFEQLDNNWTIIYMQYMPCGGTKQNKRVCLTLITETDWNGDNSYQNGHNSHIISKTPITKTCIFNTK